MTLYILKVCFQAFLLVRGGLRREILVKNDLLKFESAAFAKKKNVDEQILKSITSSNDGLQRSPEVPKTDALNGRQRSPGQDHPGKISMTISSQA